ncbi:MAG: regulatory protein RecX [Ignavibacteria bacterium]|nr:regulatory protein RecX [Ignavibacteria bacterium]
MKIISLIKKGSNIELCFDEGSIYKLDYRSVFDNGLKKNDDISDEKLEALLLQSEFQKTKDSALRLLARRPHSKYEIKIKLIRKGYSKDIIENVIQKLTDEKLIDDLVFSNAYVLELSEKKKSGIVKIKSQLLKKGIDRKIIANALEKISDIEEIENAYQLVIKKLKILKRKETDHKKIQQKLYSYLLSKGYPSELISKTLRKINLLSDEIM